MKEPHSGIFCPDCGKVRVRTEAGGVLCVDGHGKVLSNTGITKTQLKNAKRDKARWEWLMSFPDAQKASGRIFCISGHKGYFTFAVPASRKTSRLVWHEEPLKDHIVAHHNGIAYYFKPIKEQPK